MSGSHREVIQEFVEMINTHDVSNMERHTAPNHIDHNPVVDDGIDANRAFWAGIFQSFPDMKVVVHDVLVDGDRVAGRFQYSATHLGEFVGIPATGRTVTFQSIDIWRMENGLLAEHWDQIDMGDILRQLGVDPASLAGSEA